MKKVRDLRAVIDATSQIQKRLGSPETASALKELSEALQSWDDKTVAALIKKIATTAPQ